MERKHTPSDTTQVRSLANGHTELGIEQVRFEVPAEAIQALDSVNGDFHIIGQQRALRALEMAVEMRARGYNVFATGPAGTGKRTAILRVLDKHLGRVEHLKDIAYVHNFGQPDSPRALYFPAGRGRLFRQRLQELIERFRLRVVTLFEQSGFKEERDRLLMDAEGRENRTLSEFEGRLSGEGFRMVQVDENQQQRTDIEPVYEGEATSFGELQKRVTQGSLAETRWQEIRERYYRLLNEMKQVFMQIEQDRRQTDERLAELRTQTLRPDLVSELEAVRQEFPTVPPEHLDELLEDLLGHTQLFISEQPPVFDEEGNPYPVRYGTNLIVDHAHTQKAPVIFESHPDYAKLFGSQEPAVDPNGEGRLSFMNIRAGSLLRASGGFLVLRAEDILAEEESWNSLKRALQDGKTEIRNLPGPFPVPTANLKPEPVEIDVKVIIMGGENIYDILYDRDEEFQKLFKIPAEFDSTMDRDDRNTREYLSFVNMITRDEKLLPFDYSGTAAVVEYGARLAEFRDKLSTRFSLIADVIREASFWAGKAGLESVDRASVKQALDERTFLYNLPEEKIDEQIESGELLISVSGSSVGRINGLAIVDRGYYAFSRPMLITARVAPGNEGIINIERESGLSGEIHDKGVYILEGFLQSTYAKDFPLSIRASVCFEQSYVEVDGDSASSTEVYVLLSAIAEMPLRQDIAVTGSVNQMGQIQPVGGISEKIEGFYAVCRRLGLTGTQGVIVPLQNIPNLILSREVEEAIEAGAFHIYAVQTIDEGLEILTGMPAGSRRLDANGRPVDFPEGTVNYLVEKRLKEMAFQMKDFGGN
ncbi:AAA family ATPase [Salinispira pacifica]